jgi:hypothetical protein
MLLALLDSDANYISESLISVTMNILKVLILRFVELPVKKKGLILIICAIFIFSSSLLFSTRNWQSKGSFLTNVSNADIEIFELRAIDHYFEDGEYWYSEERFLIDVPLRLLGVVSLALTSLGVYFVWASRSSE